MSYIQIQEKHGGGPKALPAVHVAESVWNAEKRRPVQRRRYIGRLTPDGNVIVSKGYPNRSGERVPLARFEDMLARGEDPVAWLKSGGRRFPEGAEIAGVEDVGVARLFAELAARTGLRDCLADAFGPRKADALVVLAAFQNLRGEALYLADSWARSLPRSDRPELDLSSSGLRRLAGSLGGDAAGRELFHRLWIARLGPPEALIHDTTSISTYGALELAEFGHNRDGERLPQVNLCLVADKGTGLPLHYRVVPGSVPDVRTLATTSETLKVLGLERFSYSLDRGFYSKSNVAKMLGEGLGFTIGVPLSTRIAKDALRKSASTLRSLKSSFNFNGRETRFTRNEIDGEIFGSDNPLALFVFRHPKRKAESESALVTRALALEEKASEEVFESVFEAREWICENTGKLAKCFAASKNGGKIGIRLKRGSLARRAGVLGHAVVLTTNVEADARETLEVYRSRDAVEKIFDILKNETPWKRIGTGVMEAAEGRMFMAFVAVALRIELERSARESGLLAKLSVPEILAEIGKIRIVRMSDGKGIPLEITKKQRSILEKLKIPESLMS